MSGSKELKIAKNLLVVGVIIISFIPIWIANHTIPIEKIGYAVYLKWWAGISVGRCIWGIMCIYYSYLWLKSVMSKEWAALLESVCTGLIVWSMPAVVNVWIFFTNQEWLSREYYFVSNMVNTFAGILSLIVVFRGIALFQSHFDLSKNTQAAINILQCGFILMYIHAAVSGVLTWARFLEITDQWGWFSEYVAPIISLLSFGGITVGILTMIDASKTSADMLLSDNVPILNFQSARPILIAIAAYLFAAIITTGIIFLVFK